MSPYMCNPCLRSIQGSARSTFQCLGLQSRFWIRIFPYRSSAERKPRFWLRPGDWRFLAIIHFLSLVSGPEENERDQEEAYDWPTPAVLACNVSLLINQAGDFGAAVPVQSSTDVTVSTPSDEVVPVILAKPPGGLTGRRPSATKSSRTSPRAPCPLPRLTALPYAQFFSPAPPGSCS